MKIQINFEYNGVKYRQTIDENDIDMAHYDDIWDWWFGENDNELADRHYKDKDDEHELVFEVTADKKWMDEKNDYIISGEGLYINVYKNNYEDDFCTQIEDVEVFYA